MGSHSLLQGIFPTQGSNPCLLHRQVSSSPLSCQGSLTYPLHHYSLNKISCVHVQTCVLRKQSPTHPCNLHLEHADLCARVRPKDCQNRCKIIALLGKLRPPGMFANRWDALSHPQRPGEPCLCWLRCWVASSGEAVAPVAIACPESPARPKSASCQPCLSSRLSLHPHCPVSCSSPVS